MVKHTLVNWKDGMKINKSHFISSDNHHIQQSNLARRVFLNENNFGLLPEGQQGFQPDYDIVFSNGQVTISRFALSLVMLDGSMLRINSDDINDINTDTSKINTRFKVDDDREKEFAVIVTTRPYERISYGEYDTEDLPLKRPGALQGFNFVVEPVKQVQKAWFGNDFFVLARFSIEDGVAVSDKNYIPPSTSMLSHPRLKEIYHNVYNDILTLESALLKTASKYRTKKADNLNETLLYLSTNMLMNISRVKFEVKHKLLFEPPVNLVCLVKELANIFRNSIDIRSSAGKDGFLTEVNQILGIPKAKFIDKLNDVINLEYRHYDIQHIFVQLLAFLKDAKTIFKSFGDYDKTERITVIKVKR